MEILLVLRFIWLPLLLFVVLLVVAKLLASSQESQRALVGRLARIGLARDETEADIKITGEWIVKVFWILTLVAFLWLALAVYRQVRPVKVREREGAQPYQTQTLPYQGQTGPYGQQKLPVGEQE